MPRDTIINLGSNDIKNVYFWATQINSHCSEYTWVIMIGDRSEMKKKNEERMKCYLK